MTGSRWITTVTATTCLLLGACSGGGAEEMTSTSSSSTSSSTTADYRDEAVEAARAWIEDDAARLTAENATAEMVEAQEQEDAVNKKAGISVKGHDSVVSTEVDEGLTNTTEVVMDVCVTTDQRLLQKGKDVRTNRKGALVKPGDRQLARVEMTRDVGAGDWLVAASQVRERSC